MVIVTAQEPIWMELIVALQYDTARRITLYLPWMGWQSIMGSLPPPLNNMSDFPDNLPPPIYTPVQRETVRVVRSVLPKNKTNGLASALCHLKSSVQTIRSTSLTLPKGFFLHSFLNLSFILQQTHLLNPSLIELGLKFYIATASWLNQVALAGDSFDEMTSFKEVEIPLPTQVGDKMLYASFKEMYQSQHSCDHLSIDLGGEERREQSYL